MRNSTFAGFIRASSAAAVLLGAGQAALAGGTPENIFLIIDPTTPTSLYVGNYYKNARNIPDSNVLYMRPGPANYADFRSIYQTAFTSALTQRGIASQIDYVVIAPTDLFYIQADGLITDQCFPVTRISIGSAFSLSQVPAITPGTAVDSAAAANMFYGSNDTPLAFRSTQAYLNGVASGSASAKRYYIGALLGYAGPTGNSAADLINMIDRSVAVDGTRPTGTFYFMNNQADPARNVRQPSYATAVTSITSRAGLAQQIAGILPTGRADVRGIMTGNATLDFASANVTIQPGAFCDHLTSYAAAFDVNDQTKLTSWIAQGASGSAGAVEEPCNYTGKFPHARLHVWYFQGMSLGESYLRSLQYQPMQNLFCGDPMTRPWARFPTVSVTNMPTTPVHGVVALNTTAAATASGAIVSSLELLVDGVSKGVIIPGSSSGFSLDTRTLDDGWHDLRVLARDSATTKNMGRFVSPLIVSNHGRAVNVGVSPASGDLAQAFTFTPDVSGGSVRRVQLLQGGHVIAGANSLQPFTLYGFNLGAGPSTVVAEVTYADGRVAKSAPVSVSVANSGAPTPILATTYSLTRTLVPNSTYVIEFPASFSDFDSSVSFFQASSITQSTVLNPAFTGRYRIIRTLASATGSEQLQYRVVGPGGTSAVGTVTLRYSPEAICTADFNVDGVVNPDDLGDFITDYFSPAPPVTSDFNFDGDINPDDLGDFITAYFAGCP